MFLVLDLKFSILAAFVIVTMMVITVVFIIVYHISKYNEINRWVDLFFSGNALRQALAYHSFMAISMLFFYSFFTIRCNRPSSGLINRDCLLLALRTSTCNVAKID